MIEIHKALLKPRSTTDALTTDALRIAQLLKEEVSMGVAKLI
jgi:hypothetical protein